MPIHLPAPEPVLGGPDGKGWTRLSIASMGGLAGDECALRPRDYSHLIEAQDTRRARYGGYGPCIGDGNCHSCPIANAAPKTLRAFDDRVLARIGRDGQPYLMNRPEDGWASLAQRWTWADLARIEGWTFGPRHRDEHSDGFWLERCDSDA
ncbi:MULTISPECIES: hypothetical protein [unclassified Streptomyces]|uniref:hypothetical protein n=1 Tax=unclassified Streptomyces TaxID=2593676 RepID=UPI001367B21A|nr:MULTISPECIES: hypothetical protein [unclassified Streptomyces]NDZ98459.1 hypothetical protein [Streptomyces sp. SID10116]MYY79814.1 hypothetical protein [Streptomyces sp. SID335]MYZ16030.1 hypothetical protein [Streptomyces sp. SID337]NDZ84449.1 hypothetical protein [Streptomyces sp. SID10115]NEB43412.1 hypothetical protein [Streptomyces sp. SID339]